MTSPLLKLTVTSEPAKFVNVAVYVIVPPSTTLGVAERLIVVVSVSSVIIVEAGVVSSTRFSKLPPLAEVIVAEDHLCVNF